MEVINCESNIVMKKQKDVFIKIFNGKNDFNYENFKKEIKISRYLNNKNIAPKVLGAYINNSSYSIFFEKIEAKNLIEINLSLFTIKEKINIFKRILLKVKKLHDIGIIHNDISLSNIMLNEKSIYLVDFSESIFLNESNLKKYISFSKFFSPIEKYSKYNKSTIKTDIYSLSSVFYYIIFEKFFEFEFSFFKSKLYFDEKCDDSIVKYIKKGLNKYWLKRFKNVDEMIIKLEEIDEKL